MSTEGTIWSYVVYHRAFHPGFQGDLPYVVAIVENTDGMRYTGRVAGSSSAAPAGVEYVQRLTRRYRYEDLPWQDAQLSGLLWSPILAALPGEQVDLHPGLVGQRAAGAPAGRGRQATG